MSVFYHRKHQTPACGSPLAGVSRTLCAAKVLALLDDGRLELVDLDVAQGDQVDEVTRAPALLAQRLEDLDQFDLGLVEDREREQGTDELDGLDDEVLEHVLGDLDVVQERVENVHLPALDVLPRTGLVTQTQAAFLEGLAQDDEHHLVIGLELALLVCHAIPPLDRVSSERYP